MVIRVPRQINIDSSRQVILLTNDHRPAGQALGKALIKTAPFWMVLVMSISIILPWLKLRKVAVRSEVLSNHAVRLYFDYGGSDSSLYHRLLMMASVTPVPGSFTRVSTDPLMEWHGFATIAEPGKKGYSMVVSRAGDWTSKQIANPPEKIWIRGVPTCGVMRIVPIFRRVILVATGSGIGPIAPHVFARPIPLRLIWTAPNVRQTFGDKLVDSILEAAPDTVIYGSLSSLHPSVRSVNMCLPSDTRVHGKPDMVKLTYRLVREFNAEAVCIISNQALTRKVVYGMMSRGIPAFGAIWDS